TMTGWPGTESPVRREHVAFGAGSARATRRALHWRRRAGRPVSRFILRGVDAMETTRTLSAAQVLNRTQTPDKPVRRRMNRSNEEFAPNEFRLLIGGKLVAGASTLDVINPATGRVLTTAPRADRGQLEQAVAAAKAAFPSWAATPLRVRGGLLVKLA